jgi:hypothetical protein
MSARDSSTPSKQLHGVERLKIVFSAQLFSLLAKSKQNKASNSFLSSPSVLVHLIEDIEQGGVEIVGIGVCGSGVGEA